MDKQKAMCNDDDFFFTFDDNGIQKKERKKVNGEIVSEHTWNEVISTEYKLTESNEHCFMLNFENETYELIDHFLYNRKLSKQLSQYVDVTPLTSKKNNKMNIIILLVTAFFMIVGVILSFTLI